MRCRDLRGVLELDERIQGPDLCHHGQRLCRLPAARSAALDREPSNFDIGRFVAGDPDGFNPWRVALSARTQPRWSVLGAEIGQKGRFDTVYITASSEQQNLVAPIIAGFLEPDS